MKTSEIFLKIFVLLKKYIMYVTFRCWIIEFVLQGKRQYVENVFTRMDRDRDGEVTVQVHHTTNFSIIRSE